MWDNIHISLRFIYYESRLPCLGTPTRPSARTYLTQSLPTHRRRAGRDISIYLHTFILLATIHIYIFCRMSCYKIILIVFDYLNKFYLVTLTYEINHVNIFLITFYLIVLSCHLFYYMSINELKQK